VHPSHVTFDHVNLVPSWPCITNPAPVLPQSRLKWTHPRSLHRERHPQLPMEPSISPTDGRDWSSRKLLDESLRLAGRARGRGRNAGTAGGSASSRSLSIGGRR
jgi:hypothetical protein